MSTYRYAILKNTTNTTLQSFIGAKGTLRSNGTNGYCFYMPKIDRTIRTNRIVEGTVLGSLTVPACKELSFTTESGSIYVFTLVDNESCSAGLY